MMIIAGLGERVYKETVLGTWGERAYGLRVRGGRYGVQEAHVADVVDVDLLLEDYGEALAIEADGLDGGGESELTDNGGALRVLDYQVPWGEDKGDEGCGEEHLDDGDVSVVGAEDFGKRIGMVNAEASRCTYGTC